MSAKTLYDFSATSIQGQPADFGAQRGKVFVIVNTASKCGFTPQFAGLEQLAADYKERGLVDRKSTRLNSSHSDLSRMPSSA